MSDVAERVIALIDMDCFYVQVEEKDNVENRGKPGCVVQYKKWKGGGIIAVNYEARARGVTRHLRGDEAKEKCPEIIIYRVPELRGKADLTKYRDAGKEVIDVLCKFGVCVERASIDEAFIDMTSVIQDQINYLKKDLRLDQLPNTYVEGWGISDSEEARQEHINTWLASIHLEDHINMGAEMDLKLYLGAVLVEKMRLAVFEKTGYKCSAGISVNKMLAKLACGIHKPNKQTVLPAGSVHEFFKNFPLNKVRHLGGKLGQTLAERFECVTMDDVANIPERVLQQTFDEKTANWLYWYSRGVDHEPVQSRLLPKSVGCNKYFFGQAALDTNDKILHWLNEFCAEVSERLEKDHHLNKRTAKLLTLSVRLGSDRNSTTFSRSLPLLSYDSNRMAQACMAVLLKENGAKQQTHIWNPAVTSLGVSASKFIDSDPVPTSGTIDRFFTKKTELADVMQSSEDEETTDVLGELDVQSAKPVPEGSEILQDLAPTAIIGPKEVIPTTEPLQQGFFARRRMEIEKKPVESAQNGGHLGIVIDGDPSGDEIDRFLSTKPGSNAETVEEATVVLDVGFFAKRRVDGEKKPMEPAQSSGHVDINELFPDLDDLDLDTLALLPLDIQHRVKREVELRTGLAGNDPRTACQKCGRVLWSSELQEHEDYHLAVELQNEMSQASGSAAVVEPAAPVTPAKTKATKRSLKDKRVVGQEKKYKTIDSFFKQNL